MVLLYLPLCSRLLVVAAPHCCVSRSLRRGGCSFCIDLGVGWLPRGARAGVASCALAATHRHMAAATASLTRFLFNFLPLHRDGRRMNAAPFPREGAWQKTDAPIGAPETPALKVGLSRFCSGSASFSRTRTSRLLSPLTGSVPGRRKRMWCHV
ncbi:uncharacterized protein Tco025E_01248 [Trypanosoma conorhini]|uniref:Secreted protein n=1 Tax=Trypanosoma conorhini TaxID=83891 RepID=A0A422Q8Y2_9TRYP|nr:uncharacterized protein Tco025E_01248 [Trypanosoma conorhini]RNF26387.1 hypothetical protein Tco025E_01248 [Trypanosoma conorhini]